MNHIKLLVHGDLYKFSYDDVEGELIADNHLVSLIKEDHHDEDFKKFSDLQFPDSKILQQGILDLLGKLFPFMPHSIEGGYKYLPNEILPKKFKELVAIGIESITFFGGSFNPWHEGHSECLRQCSEVEKFIVVLPDYSPWKFNVNREPLSQFMKITKELRGDYPIYPGFWATDQRNPTFLWLEKVTVKHINWLMGDDTFVSFDKWTEVAKVLDKLEKIYIIPRLHNLDDIDDALSRIKKIKTDVKIALLDDHKHQLLSSTKLRK